VLISQNPGDICTTRVGMAGADLVIGCDPIVAAHKETLLRMQAGKTHVALNAHSAPTAAFVHNSSWQNPGSACQDEIAKAVGVDGLGSFDADTAATKLMGDSIYTNPMLLGYAWQRGWVPLDRAGVSRPEGVVTVQGYMRPAERPGLLSAADSPAARRFHNFDISAMGAAIGLPVAPFGLAVVVPGRARPDGGLGSTPAPNQGGVPSPATGFPAPSNPHLGYAITWFGLALAWAAIFALWASRRISTP
jgi:hypothetical protein